MLTKETADSLEAFVRAAAQLKDDWDNNEVEGQELVKAYPFHKDFDEMFHLICLWRDANKPPAE